VPRVKPLWIAIALAACGNEKLDSAVKELEKEFEKAEARVEARAQQKLRTDVPAGAAKAIQRVRAAIATRDFEELERCLDDDVADFDNVERTTDDEVASLPNVSAEVLVRRWRKEPRLLEELDEALRAECVIDELGPEHPMTSLTCAVERPGKLFVILSDSTERGRFEIDGIGRLEKGTSRKKHRLASEVPAAARKAIARAREAIAKRDHESLRGLLAPNVLDIDSGRERSRVVALRQWKATPRFLEQLDVALGGECEVEAVHGAADDAEVDEVTCGSVDSGKLFVVLSNETTPETFEIRGVGSF
jgi:hypothetical protein